MKHAELEVADGTLTEVAEGVHAWVQPDGTWWVNNAGAVHDDGTVLIVDTCTNSARTTQMLAAVDEATGTAPVKWAVNTHQHGDHTYGNALLPRSAVLIGHEKMRTGLDEDFVFDACPPFWTPVPEWGVTELRLPDLVFDSALSLDVGSLRVDVRHPGHPAHTTGDAIVHVPDRCVLFSGDLIFNGLTPLLLMGSVEGARRSLDWIASFEPLQVVPGHGPVIASRDLDRVLAEHDRYYRFVAHTTTEGLKDGLTPIEAVQRTDLAEFADWPDSERLVLNVHRAYADHLGFELDLVAAMNDAVAVNGGPMVTKV